MKYLILLSIFFLFIAQACDIIEGPYDEAIIIDTIDHSMPVKKVLLEDFTGHKCGNCPCAAEQAILLDSLYKGRVIVVATHVGFFAETNSSGAFSYDFRTPVGEELNTYFSFDAAGLPKGMVDRKALPTRLLSYGAWAGAVDSMVRQTPDIDINLKATYNATNRIFSLEAELEYLSDGNGNHQLVVYVVEDSIINWQLFYKECSATGLQYNEPDYLHRHVLRKGVTGTWGDQLTSSTVITKGSKINKSYSDISIDLGWKEKDISIVVFVQDNITKEIIQVEETRLIH